jgi:hypothetical protein
MADMAKGFFDGMSPNGPMTFKRVAIIGVSGGLFLGASDYFVDDYFVDEDDVKTQARYRAVSQMALGLGVAYVVKRWNRDVAVGVAVGGIVGGARRLWISEEMPDRMADWFDSDDTTTNNNTTPPPARDALGYSAGAPDGKVIFTGPARARVRQVA